MEFWTKLFDTTDFPARWDCGDWSDLHGWLHIISDIGIWSAYFAIPAVLLYFGWRRSDFPFRKLFFLFAAFILLCGTTHIMEAIIFWWPAYRLAGVIKFITAVVSWTTVLALFPIIPLALAMRSPEDLEREIGRRKRAEEDLQQSNVALEHRVDERTVELRAANDSLEEERERFRTTLASIGDGVIATDSAGRVTFVNEVAATLTGWSPEEALGRPLEEVFDIVSETTRQPVPSPVQQALAEKTAVGLSNHTLLVAKNGTERPVEDSAAPIRDANGSVIGVVLVFRDGSEQRKLERRRSARMAVTQTLAQAGTVEEALPRILEEVCTGLGWDIGSYLAVDEQSDRLRCQELWHHPSADFAEFVAATRSAHFAKGSSLPGRVWQTRASEWITDVTQDANFLRAETALRDGLRGALAFPVALEGTVLGVIEFFSREVREPDEDLLEMVATLGGQIGQFIERRRAESELRNAEERVRSVMENAIDGIITLDEAGRIETFNQAAEDLFGYRNDEVRGEAASILIPQTVPEEQAGRPQRMMPNGEAGVTGGGKELLARRKDGSTFPVELSVSEFVLRGRRHFTWIARDISERKRNEDELREIAAKLSEANRRKSEFLATLAHELRNPLAPIRTGLEVMKMAKDDPVTIEQTRATMERQTRQLISLVDDLLDVSRITRGKFELRKHHVKLGDVLQSAVEAALPFVREAGHELDVDIPEETIFVEADPNRLAQVVSNLLDNAVKYTPEGGEIRLSAERHGSDIEITVSDNGLGIPPELCEKIFEMFTQIARPTEKANSGLGIGLTVVKSLTEMHGGNVEVYSEGPHQGSRFVIRLPDIIVESASDPPSPSPTEKPRMGMLKVLVVDDNLAAVETLSMVVRMLGHDVKTAGDGREGVQLAESFQPDVVLMDIGMPRMNGYEAARFIRQQPWGGSMILVALTGWGQDEDKLRAKEAGFDHHLVKPAEPTQLEKLFVEASAKRDR